MNGVAPHHAAERNRGVVRFAVFLGSVDRNGDRSRNFQRAGYGDDVMRQARGLQFGNGIITVNTEAQAWARARASELNKGGDAARAALAMLRIKRRLAKA